MVLSRNIILIRKIHVVPEGLNDQNIATTLIALKLSKILIIIFSELFDTKKLQRLGRNASDCGPETWEEVE